MLEMLKDVEVAIKEEPFINIDIDQDLPFDNIMHISLFNNSLTKF